MHTRTRAALATFLGTVVALALFGPAEGSATTTAASAPVTIQVLSNRADLISGGDALVQVNRPPGSGGEKLTVTVGDRDVSSAFNSSGVGLVTGLALGPDTLTATLADGRGARIVITNHPIGGPIFAGPQVQPWVCNTQNPPSNSGGTPTVAPVGLGPPTDPQCDTKPAVSYVYKDAVTGQFTTYDPASPPASSVIATTTTDQGAHGAVHRSPRIRGRGSRHLRDRHAQRAGRLEPQAADLLRRLNRARPSPVAALRRARRHGAQPGLHDGRPTPA